MHLDTFPTASSSALREHKGQDGRCWSIELRQGKWYSRIAFAHWREIPEWVARACWENTGIAIIILQHFHFTHGGPDAA